MATPKKTLVPQARFELAKALLLRQVGVPVSISHRGKNKVLHWLGNISFRQYSQRTTRALHPLPCWQWAHSAKSPGVWTRVWPYRQILTKCMFKEPCTRVGDATCGALPMQAPERQKPGSLRTPGFDVEIKLERQSATSTRFERRIEDVPLRIQRAQQTATGAGLVLGLVCQSVHHDALFKK